jgi:uncharacterized membrane protein
MAGRLPGAWQAAGWIGAVAGCIVYALLTHRAASAADPGLLEAAILIVPLMAFALVVAWRSSARHRWLALWLAVAVALFLARDRVPAGTAWVLLAQHVCINLALCIAFGRTLGPGTVPMISRLAERVHGPLTPRLQRYTRGATWAWVAYFGVIALASVVLFALAPLELWSAFINFLSLPLLLAMFGAEYLVRVIVIPRDERAGFLQAVTSWRQMSREKQARTPE